MENRLKYLLEVACDQCKHGMASWVKHDLRHAYMKDRGEMYKWVDAQRRDHWSDLCEGRCVGCRTDVPNQTALALDLCQSSEVLNHVARERGEERRRIPGRGRKSGGVLPIVLGGS